MTVETLPFDAADCIRSPEAQDELISDAIDSGDPGYVALALGVVARVHGMSQLSRETGLTREGLTCLIHGMAEIGRRVSR